MEQLRIGQESAVDNVRKRYEDSLKHAQEALEMQTVAAKDQISRLEDLLRRSQESQNNLLNYQAQIASNDEFSPGDRDANGSIKVGEILGIQHSLDKANHELNDTRRRLFGLSEEHAVEMAELRQHFLRYRRAQEGMLISFPRIILFFYRIFLLSCFGSCYS